MERYVITINRQFGSMGRPIARHLSELLKINYYDRDIVEQTAGKLNLSVSTISAAEDYVKSRFSFMRYPLGADMQAKQDEIYHAQEEIIRDFAAKESCIIVGRCADYILTEAGIPAFKIYLYADLESRIRRAGELEENKGKDLRKIVPRREKLREVYYKQYTGQDMGVCSNYNICLDTGTLGAEKCTQILCDALKAQ